MKLDIFLPIAKAKENFRGLGRGATSNEISAIERELKITLPLTYRQLIEAVGWIGWFGVSIFGVEDGSEHGTADSTTAERESLAKYPQTLLPLPLNGNIIAEIFGGGFCFLYSMESERAGQISAHAPDERYREVQYWDSLEDYFDYLIHGVHNWHAVDL